MIESYFETYRGKRVEVAEDEAIGLLHDPVIWPSANRLVSWLNALTEGRGDPLQEPNIMADSRYLNFRSDGGAVVIFWPSASQRRVDVLHFAAAASGFPTVGCLSVAEARLKSWRGI